MRIRNKLNGGLVVVEDEVGNRLVQGSFWEEAKPRPKPEPAPAPAPRSRRPRKKPAQTVTEE